MRVVLLLKYVALLLPLVSSVAFAQSLPVFPGAEGYGSRTVAGSGRHLSPPSTRVYKVTSLSNSGSGTLRECAEASGPRVCVFETSGVIDITADIRIKNPYLTIAGQTAPSPGITIIGAGMQVLTNDVLIQHLRIRPGDKPYPPYGNPESRDAFGFSGHSPVFNVVLDRCSLSWGIDENLQVWNWTHAVRDITISNSIIANSLDRSTHPKGAHSKGLILGGEVRNGNISVLRNYLAHNVERNVRITSGARVEVLNNVIYNWVNGSGTLHISNSGRESTGRLDLDVIGNFYKAGPSTSYKGATVLSGGNINSTTKVFVRDNIGPLRLLDTLTDWLMVASDIPSANRSTSRVSESGLVGTIRGASANVPVVLQNVGARAGDRDVYDRRVVTEFNEGTGQVINCVSNNGTTNCQKNAGGWPVLAQNRRTLTVPANPNADSNGNGYTNLEDWLHSFYAEVQSGGGGGGGGDTVPPAPPKIVDVVPLN